MRTAALAATFWTAVGLVFTLSRFASATHGPAFLFDSLAVWWTWGLLAPIVLDIAGRIRARHLPIVAWFGAHLLVGVITSFADVYLNAAIDAIMHLGPWSRVAGGALVGDAVEGIFWNLLVYALIVGVWEAYGANRRYLSAELRMERLERSYSEARLSALRMQLDPHFFFNALNTISAVVVRDPTLARTMIEHLGDLLRLSLDPESRQTSTLEEELTFLDHYVAIQKIRFGDALRFDSDIGRDVMKSTVPSLFLQPLVENAIRHGLASRARGGSVRVVARSVDKSLDIRVLDDGVGLPVGWNLEGSTGLGLGITRERIAGLYPEGSTRFSVLRRPGGGTEISIRVPFDVVTEELERASA